MKSADLESYAAGLGRSPYLSYYGLHVEPFQQNLDPRFLWIGERSGGALAALKSGVRENKGLLLLTGDVGTGKTTLTNALIEALSDEVDVAKIPYPRLDPLDFFRVLATAYSLTAPVGSREMFLVALERFLSQAAVKARSVLLVVDEAQSLSPELFEEIWSLAATARAVNVLLVGQTELKAMLSRAEAAGGGPRVAITRTIDPLAAGEVGAYIEHRLRVAGATQTPFGPDAIHAIFALSRGIPRVINAICDLALLSGCERGLPTIDSETIRNCGSRLGVSEPDADRRGIKALWPAFVRHPLRSAEGRPGKPSPHKGAHVRQRHEPSAIVADQADRGRAGVPPQPEERSRRNGVHIPAILPGVAALVLIAGYVVYPVGLADRADVSAPIAPLASPRQESQPPPESDERVDKTASQRQLDGNELPRPDAVPNAVAVSPTETVRAVPAFPAKAPVKTAPPSVGADGMKKPVITQERRAAISEDATVAEISPRAPTREPRVAETLPRAPTAPDTAVAETPLPAPTARATIARESADSPDPSRIIDWLLKEYAPQKD
jgi:type II secretory pathway predicted ATPase ExeA